MNWKKVLKVTGIVLIVLWVLFIVFLSIPQTTVRFTAELPFQETYRYIPLFDEIIPLFVYGFPESLLIIVPYLAILVGAVLLARLKTEKCTKEERNAQ